jgi:tRNA pseudouridine13 synthase
VQGDGWQERLDTLSAQGVPNYFGPQRFGGDNLERAMQWLPQRRRRSISHFKKGLYLSVLRSYLFNEILGRRVSDGSWQDLLSGDVALRVEDGVGDRVGDGAGATAPLWGRGRSATTEAAAEVEASVLAPHARLCDDLEYAGVQQQRRALVLYPQTLDWQTSGAEVQLRFGLAPGCFATSFLLEAFDLQHRAERWLAVNAPEAGRM